MLILFNDFAATVVASYKRIIVEDFLFPIALALYVSFPLVHAFLA